jgi:hypothetical protein
LKFTDHDGSLSIGIFSASNSASVSRTVVNVEIKPQTGLLETQLTRLRRRHPEGVMGSMILAAPIVPGFEGF